MQCSSARLRVRSLLGLLRATKEHQSNHNLSLRSTRTPVSQSFATSSIRRYEPDPYAETPNERPRWEAPPPLMTAPYRSKPAVDNDFPVNEDPEKLDRVYDQILGHDGCKVLTEEVKWLAVTHKSFDHGRRGYNERLAFLGRRIVELQTSLALVHAPPSSSSSKSRASEVDEYGRTAFEHPALQSVGNLGHKTKLRYIERKRIAQLATSYGVDTVMRWKPRTAKNKAHLKASGIDVVLEKTLLAVIGAVALQKGAIIANDIVRERILAPLGLR